MKSLLISTMFLTMSLTTNGQTVEWNSPKAGNPIIPGYFADPTIRKFGDTYYIYSTTDGTGNGYGPPQVWVSKDFIHWRNVVMNWPTTEVVWAPDVVRSNDGMYRYYYCTPCEIRVGESSNPIGPWQNRLGETNAVLVPDRFVHNAITLDPMLFQDDDGSEYLYFGTWGIYKGFGCGVAKLSSDGKSFTDKKLIENTEITDFFEAPYVFKKDGIYYFTYSSGSCHDSSYRVQYAVSSEGPMGPYTYKGCILKTNSDGSVHGPGHHSILVEDNNYYIVYHRHNIPQSVHGFNRQICIDKLEFDSLGNILPVTPTHSSPLPLQSSPYQLNIAENIAYGSKVTSSSVYSEDFVAEYAVDDNNATLWRAKNCNSAEWIQIDFGAQKEFNQIWTEFEYATFFYQYKIETSDDGKKWEMFSDQQNNIYQGSPMIDEGKVFARYIRITITDTQKNGHFPAIWNIKVFNATTENDPRKVLPEIKVDETSLISGYPWIHRKDVSPSDRSQTEQLGNKLISINASDYPVGSIVKEFPNKGLNGIFKCESGIPVVPKSGKVAFKFDGHSSMVSNFSLPNTMTYNAPYTINAWILNPNLENMECVAQFTASATDLATIEFRNGTNPNEGIIAHNASFENNGAKEAIKPDEWQFWSVVYDGYMEKIYCNGKLVSSKNNFLMIRPEGQIIIGNNFKGVLPFDGYVHSIEFYDRILSEEEINETLASPSSYTVKEAEEYKKLSKLDTQKFSLKINPISPTQAIVSFEDKDHSPLPNGLYEYSFGEYKNKLTRTASNEYIINTEDKSKTIYGQVYDVFGGSSNIIKGKVKINKSKFIDMTSNLSIPLNEEGILNLESANSYLEYDSSKCGPLSVVDIQGDFILECKVIDMSGMSRHSTPSYNEGGIIIIDNQGNGKQNLLHLGVFPNYDCGNMLTIVNRRGRPQYKNDKGWNFNPYMQLERRNNYIYARTSKDGINWEDMPNSPFEMNYGNKILQVGLYQTTYTENHAYMTFNNIKIWKKQ